MAAIGGGAIMRSWCAFVAWLVRALRGCRGGRRRMACRAFREWRSKSWIDPVCGNAVMEILGTVERALPNRDAIPRRDSSIPREVETKRKHVSTFVSALFPLFAIFIPEVETKWKQVSTSESSISNETGVCDGAQRSSPSL
jgi:hypothetical protein